MRASDMSLLYSLIPEARDVLALGPEELAGILLELLPRVPQAPKFLAVSFTQGEAPYDREYPPPAEPEILLAVGESISWLETQGLIMPDPADAASAGWYRLTRRGRDLRSRADLESYRRANALPRALLQAKLAEKVYPLFARGDHDTAVFQAFKEVEVAVREMALHFKAADCANLYGRELMQRAFHPEDGPLTDSSLSQAERQSEMFLFAGAIGHAKNPTSHREVHLSREEAAHLIVFADYLLDRVTKRLM